MARTLTGSLGTSLSRWLHVHSLAALSDAQLVERFVSGNEEEIFALFLTRHGPLVHSVCRRILGNEADAEDAFQATFLLLAQSGVDPQA